MKTQRPNTDTHNKTLRINNWIAIFSWSFLHPYNFIVKTNGTYNYDGHKAQQQAIQRADRAEKWANDLRFQVILKLVGRCNRNVTWTQNSNHDYFHLHEYYREYLTSDLKPAHDWKGNRMTWSYARNGARKLIDKTFLVCYQKQLVFVFVSVSICDHCLCIVVFFT